MYLGGYLCISRVQEPRQVKRAHLIDSLAVGVQEALSLHMGTGTGSSPALNTENSYLTPDLEKGHLRHFQNNCSALDVDSSSN